jgi:hypothetical protein
VLLPEWVVQHRLDSVDVIGQAISAKLRGATVGAIANELGMPVTTVRDWWSRYHARAPALKQGSEAWTANVTTLPWRRGSDDVDRAAAEALGAAWHTAVRLCKGRLGQPWHFFSLITGGAALATNTSPPPTGKTVSREMAFTTKRPPPRQSALQTFATHVRRRPPLSLHQE